MLDAARLETRHEAGIILRVVAEVERVLLLLEIRQTAAVGVAPRILGSGGSLALRTWPALRGPGHGWFSNRFAARFVYLRRED